MADSVLTIRTDTWHYQYFNWIRTFWGLDTKTRTSLCPYCQTIIWFSVAAIVAFPLIAVWYLYFQMFRLLFNTLDLVSKVLFDGKLKKLDEVADSFLQWIEKSESVDKWGNKAFYGLTFLMLTIFIVVLTYVVSFLGFYFFTHSLITICHTIVRVIPEFIAWVPSVPGMIWSSLVSVSNFIFTAFSEFGNAISKAYFFLAISSVHIFWFLERFFTNGPLWLQIAYWAAISAGVIIACVLIGFIAYEISTSERVVKYLENRVLEREERLQKIREKEVVRLRNQSQVRSPVSYEDHLENWQSKQKSPGFFDKLVALLQINIFSKTEQVGEVAYKMVGIIPMFLTFLWGIKKGICPTVVFISEEEIEYQKKAAAEKLEKEREERKVKASKEYDSYTTNSPVDVTTNGSAVSVGNQKITLDINHRHFLKSLSNLKKWSITSIF